MAKYYGFVGYAEMQETALDVWQEVIVEREAIGDVLKNTRRWVGDDHLNDDLVINNKLSILADPYAYQNFHSIRYATYMGTKWKVTNVEVAYPRLILDLGGVYNEQTKTGAE